MYSSIKDILKSKLSNDQKLLLRLCSDISKKPENTKLHLNRFRYTREALHNPQVDFVPPVFVATVTDNCNLRCPTCLYLLENPNKFTPSYIDVEEFHQTLKRYNSKNMAEIIFLTGGEPLMHPDFDKLVDICKKYRASVKTSTNGILIKGKISSLSMLDYVNVSIDAYDHGSFEKYRGGTTRQFDQIIDGLKALKEKGVYFSISYLLMNENLAGVDKMIAIAEEIRPPMVYFHNINPHGCEQYRSLTCNDEKTNTFLKKILSRSDYPFDVRIPAIFDTESDLFRRAKCRQPWHYFCFNSAGDVSYCCHLAHNAKVGNVFADYNFNSPDMVRFRADVIKGKILKSCLYCQRRFMDSEFAVFDSKSRKWIVNNAHG